MRNTYYTPRTRRTPKRTPRRMAMGGAWTKLPMFYEIVPGGARRLKGYKSRGGYKSWGDTMKVFDRYPDYPTY